MARTPPASAKAGEGDFVAALAKGLTILEAFTPQEPRLSLAKITHLTGLPKTTVFRLLQTLQKLGFVVFDEERKVFFPGPRAMSLGATALSAMDIVDVVQPHLNRLFQTTKEIVNYGILDGDAVVYCVRMGPRQLVRIDAPLGARVPVHNTAIGRAFLAFLPEDQRQDLLTRTSRNLPKAEASRLKKLISEAERAGYAICDGDADPDVRAVAVPIRDRRGKMGAAINVVAPISRMSFKRLVQDVVPLLFDCAEEIAQSVRRIGE